MTAFLIVIPAFEPESIGFDFNYKPETMNLLYPELVFISKQLVPGI